MNKNGKQVKKQKNGEIHINMIQESIPFLTGFVDLLLKSKKENILKVINGLKINP